MYDKFWSLYRIHQTNLFWSRAWNHGIHLFLFFFFTLVRIPNIRLSIKIIVIIRKKFRFFQYFFYESDREI